MGKYGEERGRIQMLDKLADLISKIELAIRYLLSGAAVCAIYLLSIADPSHQIEWIAIHPLLAAIIVVALGVSIYSVYRGLFYVVGDGAGWLLRLSAPGLFRKKRQFLYHDAYSTYISWRHDAKFPESLNEYLHYRWAVVHFLNIMGIALLHALLYRESRSVIDAWPRHTCALMIICFVVGVWQASFLFRMERELYRKKQRKVGT